MASTVDVLLVVVTDVEREGVLDTFAAGGVGAPHRTYTGVSSYWHFPPIGGANVALVQSQMGSGGPGGSAQVVTEAISLLRPQSVIVSGIAFGVNTEGQNVADVLVSTQILDYELCRVGTDDAGNLVEVARGARPDASARLLDRFTTARLANDGLRVHRGLLLSGAKLVDNIDYRDKLRAFAPEAIGGEMEGAGVYSAAQRVNRDWILVKAICDFADGRKREDKQARQRRAARASATAVLRVLQDGGLAGAATGQQAHVEPPVPPRSRKSVFQVGTVALIATAVLMVSMFYLVPRLLSANNIPRGSQRTDSPRTPGTVVPGHSASESSASASTVPADSIGSPHDSSHPPQPSISRSKNGQTPSSTLRRMDVSASDKYYDLDSPQPNLGISSAVHADSDVGLRPFDIRAVNGAEIAKVSDRTQESCASTAGWTSDPLKFRNIPAGTHICVKTARGLVSITFDRFDNGWDENVGTITVTIAKW